MKDLLNVFKNESHKKGFQCIVVSSYDDLCTKLDCMGGSYKGFVMSDKLEGFCMFYIDTDRMREEVEEWRMKLDKIRLRCNPEEKAYVAHQPEEYAKRFIDGNNLYSFLDAYYKRSEAIATKRNKCLFRRIFGV